MTEIPFAIQEGATGVPQNSRETLVNMYAEQPPSGRSKLVRRQRPGLAVAKADTGQKRAIERHRGITYAVIGATLYSFDGTTLKFIGSLATDDSTKGDNSAGGRCSMIFNDNDEILISDGQSLWKSDGSTVSRLALPSGVTAGHLTYLGGYGILSDVGTGKFYITGLNDFTSVSALDFATAEQSPDNLVRVYADRELYLAGSETTEIWQFTGNSDFPFQLIGNATMKRGCSAALSYAAEDNTVFFLGDDLCVYRVEGYRPSRISTHAVEERIRGYPAASVSGAWAFTYTVRGHKFYVLTFPDAGTEVFDMATGLWHRADSYGFPHWRVVGSLNGPSTYVLGPGGIDTLSDGLSTDEGGIMVRKAISAPGYADGNRITMYDFWLDAEVGRAPANTDANVMLRIALDGETFGNERVRSLGAIGEYDRRAIWRQLGTGRRPTIEVSMSDATPFNIMGTGATFDVAAD